MSVTKRIICMGYGEWENRCPHPVPGPDQRNPYWCDRCDRLRLEKLDEQITALFGPKARP